VKIGPSPKPVACRDDTLVDCPPRRVGGPHPKGRQRVGACWPCVLYIHHCVAVVDNVRRRGTRKWLGRPRPSVFNNSWGTRNVLTDFRKHGEHDLAGRDGIANLRNPPTPSAHCAPRRYSSPLYQTESDISLKILRIRWKFAKGSGPRELASSTGRKFCPITVLKSERSGTTSTSA
jgi:hypothetical protein